MEVKTMHKAIIQDVEKTDDELIITIEFIDGKESFIKRYPFVHLDDIKNTFNATIQMELKRVNDLHAGYATIKARIGEEIVQK